MSTALIGIEQLFKALADTTRLRMLSLLSAGEICVCHIHESLNMSQPKASRHLAYLRNAGLVDTRRDGLWIHYRLATLPDPVLRTIVESAIHALGHVAALKKDATRLEKRTGCCVPTHTTKRALPCCTEALACQ